MQRSPIDDFLDPILRPIIARWLVRQGLKISTLGAGVISAWLAAHGADPDHTGAIVAGVSAGLLALAEVILSYTGIHHSVGAGMHVGGAMKDAEEFADRLSFPPRAHRNEHGREF